MRKRELENFLDTLVRYRCADLNNLGSAFFALTSLSALLHVRAILDLSALALV